MAQRPIDRAVCRVPANAAIPSQRRRNSMRRRRCQKIIGRKAHMRCESSLAAWGGERPRVPND